MGVNVRSYEGEGYSVVQESGSWKIAIMNYSDRFSLLKPIILEKHFCTDECFVLLKGTVELLTIPGDDPADKRSKLEKMTLLPDHVTCVEKGTWHHLLASKDSKVIVFENKDTSMKNTVREEFKGENIELN